MFNSKGVIPIGPEIVLLAVLTFMDFLIMLTFSEMFINNCCDMHEHVAQVSNRAVIGSILRVLTAKYDNFNFVHSRLDMV